MSLTLGLPQICYTRRASMYHPATQHPRRCQWLHIMYVVSALTCDDVETPSESCDGDRDFANASAASAESVLPACEFADVLLLLLSLIVPGNDRFFRKLYSKQL